MEIKIDMSKEIWRPIKDFEDIYEVSNMGRVRRIGGNIKKPQDNRNGYPMVMLYRHCKHKKIFIHRAVAEAFVPNPRGVNIVNHKDETRNNNRADNLEWVTHMENIHYGTAQERKLAKDRARRGKPNTPLYKKVRCVETGEVFESGTEVCKKFNVHDSNLSKCLKGKRHTTGGYHWEYAE